MPNQVQTLAGTTIGITASTPGTYNEAGYDALVYTTVGEVTDLPEFGKSYNLVTHLPIAGRQLQKFKGSYNNGTLTLTMARDDDDAGQVVCEAAVASDNEYAFEITYQEAGRKDWFSGRVMSFTSVGGGADAIVNRVMSIELTRDVIVAA